MSQQANQVNRPPTIELELVGGQLVRGQFVYGQFAVVRCRGPMTQEMRLTPS